MRGPALGRGPGGRCLVGNPGRGADALHPVFREEPGPLRQLPVDDVRDRALRHLLLPRDSAAPRAHGRLRGERLPGDQLRPQARPGRESAAHPVSDQQRVPAAERDPGRGPGRRRRLRRTDPQADRDADGRAPGPALPPDGPRADPPVRVRHHPHLADAPQRAAVGQRRPVGLHDRHLAPDRSDDGARCGHRRQRAEDVGDERLRILQQPAHGLQPGPRRVRVHRDAVGQGRPAPVPVRAAQVGDRRRRERLSGSVQDRAGGFRPAVRQVLEGSLQAVPRQGAPGRLRAQPGAQPGEDPLQQRADRGTIPLGRPDRRRHRQPQRQRGRHRAGLGQGRQRHPQPDQGLRPEIRLRVHRHAGRPLEHRAVAVMGPRRPAGLLRPRREVAHADPAERADARHRSPLRHADAGRAGIARRVAGRQEGGLRGAAGRHERHLRDRPRHARDHQPDHRWVRRCRPDLVAGRAIHRLHGADQRQREAVPRRRGLAQEDPAHVRHARRRGGAIPRRRHPGLPVHRHQSHRADRPRRGAQRPHLQHLDAEPEDRRAAAIHRHHRRQHHRGGDAAGAAGPADGVHRLLQGRLRAARPGAARPDHHRRVIRFRLARRHHRLPGAPGPHADGRQDQAQGQVREDVRGWPAAGERRRDQRRRPVRRNRGDVQRCPRRPAVQHVCGLGGAVPGRSRSRT